jgi:UDP-glucose 4-epimerase
MKTILLTGATGYIGSHTWVELLSAGFNVIGFDNFCNSNPKVLERIETITGKKPVFIQGDVRDRTTLNKLFTDHKIDGAVHFAALKAVGESVAKPLTYYDNNLNGLLNVLSVMGEHDCKCFVFSSSATVYGDPESVPINEQAKLQPTNPYGRTKLMSEEILRDLEISDPKWRIAYLRYFNPSGAHESGLIGEDPKGIPNNLSPLVARVASGRMEKLMVYGNDWATPDGTGVRDYIHVVDLALGHVKAIEYLLNDKPSLTVNLGTGQGYSVLELIHTYAKASGKPIPYEITNRRPGDIATCYADTKMALDTLGWKAERGLEKMCSDGWKWHDTNPHELNKNRGV